MSPTAWPPPGHAPSSRTVPNTVRVSSTSNRRRTTRCGHPALLSAVRSLSDVARDVPSTQLAIAPRCRRRCRCCPGPRCRRCSGSSLMLSLSPSSLKLLPSSLSLLLSSIANFVPNRTFEPLGRIAAHVSALKPRPPTVAVVAVPVLAVAVVVAVRVAEAADAVPRRGCCRCRSPSCPVALAVAVAVAVAPAFSQHPSAR